MVGIDFDYDGIVDYNDMTDFVLSWLADPCSESWRGNCDISDPNDGLINFDDFAWIANNWMLGLE